MDRMDWRSFDRLGIRSHGAKSGSMHDAGGVGRDIARSYSDNRRTLQRNGDYDAG